MEEENEEPKINVRDIAGDAVKIAKEAANYANIIADECAADVKSINAYNTNYLEVIDEEINRYDDDDASDDDLIFPNMNYFNAI